MTKDWISKSPDASGVAPNMRDYDRTRHAFTWTQARALLDGLPGGSRS